MRCFADVDRHDLLRMIDLFALLLLVFAYAWFEPSRQSWFLVFWHRSTACTVTVVSAAEWLKAPINSELCLKFRSTQAEDLKALTVCQVFWMREWESVKGSESHTFTPKFSEEAAEWSCRRSDRNHLQLPCWSQESAPPVGCQVWFISSRAIQEMKSEDEFKHSLVLNSWPRSCSFFFLEKRIHL